MKVLADRPRPCFSGGSVCQLLQMIKSAAARGPTNDDETVGEAQDRVFPWSVAASQSFVLIAGTTVVAYYVIYGCPLLTLGTPWLVLPATILWGVYMAAVAVATVCIDLYLPRTPVALRDAFLDVGLMWVGVPLMVIDHTVVFFGHDWMVIAMVFLLAALIAAVLAFWLWLGGIYGIDSVQNRTGSSYSEKNKMAVYIRIPSDM